MAQRVLEDGSVEIGCVEADMRSVPDRAFLTIDKESTGGGKTQELCLQGVSGFCVRSIMMEKERR